MKPKLLRKKLLFLLPALFLLLTGNGYSQYGENLVVNGGFEDGIQNWSIINQSGLVSTLTASTDAHTGSGAAQVEVTTGGNLVKISLTSDPIMGVSDTNQYLVRAWMKADAAGKLARFKVLAYNDDESVKKSRSSDDIPLTTEYKEYIWIYNSTSEATNKMEVIIQCGQDLGVYTFDDVSIQKITGIANGDVEIPGLFNWVLTVDNTNGAAATMEEETTSPYEGNGSVKVDVTAVDEVPASVDLLNDTKFYVTQGKDYLFTFFAKGAAEDSLISRFSTFDVTGTYLTAVDDTFELTADWVKYGTVYTPDVDVSYLKPKLEFGKQTGTYFIDNMMMEEYTRTEITSVPVTAATRDAAYSYQLSFNGTGTFSVETDPASAWLSIDGNGLLSGTPTTVGDVEVTITFTDGYTTATQTFTLVISSPVSVDTPGASSLKIYPNPATEQVVLENLHAGQTLRVTDITGKELLKTLVTGSRMQIETGNWNSGIYFVILGEHEQVRKLVIR